MDGLSQNRALQPAAARKGVAAWMWLLLVRENDAGQGCYLLSNTYDDLVCLVARVVDELLQLVARVAVLTQGRLRSRHFFGHLFTGIRRLRALDQLVQLTATTTPARRAFTTS